MTKRESFEEVLAYLRANSDRALADLVEFASIPSISPDPAYQDAVNAAAQWVARRRGAPLGAAGRVRQFRDQIPHLTSSGG